MFLIHQFAVATPMLATSCGEDKKEVTTIDRPTATTNVIDAGQKKFDAWKADVEKSENFASDITTFFADKAGGVTKDNIATIAVEKNPAPVQTSESPTVEQKVDVTLTLKDNIEFKKTSSEDQSKFIKFTVTVKLLK